LCPVVPVALTVLVLIGACGTVGPEPDPDPVPTERSRALPTIESSTGADRPAARTAQPDCGGAQNSYDPLPNLPAAQRFPDGSTLARIRDRGRLIVGTAGDKPLLSVRNPQTGALEGIDIELARAMAQAVLGDPEAVEFRTIPYGAREQALISGDVDMVAHSMTMTCDRWQRVGFSAEYYRDAQRLLVRTDSTVDQVEDLDPAGATVCVAEGTTTIDQLHRLGVRNIVPVIDAADCLAYFQRDEVDAITSNELILLGYLQQDRYAKIVGRELSDEPIALAFRSEDVDFIRYANTVLADLRRSGRLERIFRDRMSGMGVEPNLGAPHYGRNAG